jgi:hypothetical protein
MEQAREVGLEALLSPDGELADVTDRKTSNLSRTLHTLERYGIVELRKTDREIRPIVKAQDFELRFGLLEEGPGRRSGEGQGGRAEDRSAHAG